MLNVEDFTFGVDFNSLSPEQRAHNRELYRQNQENNREANGEEEGNGEGNEEEPNEAPAPVNIVDAQPG